MRVLLYSIGDELFASPLATIEESIDCPFIRPMPGADDHAVGVVDVRGRRIAAYSPMMSLNVAIRGEPGAALIVEGEHTPIALLISDVDDAIEIDATNIRIAPGSDNQDGVLLGVFQYQGRLVSLVDPLAIRDVCLAAGAKH
ncbi:MAG: chemotaxis protein CheW [Gemmatimonadaceae bacterium]|nr:chemotaxis protein CheW [Gemmatimonadaceae bacterium]